jgi:FAD synthase
LRDERRFPHIDALKAQISADVDAAKQLLSASVP